MFFKIVKDFCYLEMSLFLSNFYYIILMYLTALLTGSVYKSNRCAWSISSIIKLLIYLFIKLLTNLVCYLLVYLLFILLHDLNYFNEEFQNIFK
jgi:hypothetical protein